MSEQRSNLKKVGIVADSVEDEDDGPRVQFKIDEKASAQSSKLRIQEMMTLDRPATFGDETDKAEQRTLSEAEIAKIKMAGSGLGVVFSLFFAKGLIMAAFIIPIWYQKYSILNKTKKQCLDDQECRWMKYHLEVDGSKCPTTNTLVRGKILADDAAKPIGVWWSQRDSKNCYWFPTGNQVTHPNLPPENQRVNWFEAQKKCRELHPRAKLATLEKADEFYSVQEQVLMVNRLKMRYVSKTHNMTRLFSDFWVGSRRCETKSRPFKNPIYGQETGSNINYINVNSSLCNREKTVSEKKANGTMGRYYRCGKDTKGAIPPPWNHDDLSRFLADATRKRLNDAGAKKLLRAIELEETDFLTSYVEYNLQNESFNERKRELEEFGRRLEQLREKYFPCENADGFAFSKGETKFVVDSTFFSFCNKISPMMTNPKLYPEFHRFFEKDNEKMPYYVPIKGATLFSIPCVWKLNYICELECDKENSKMNDCHNYETFSHMDFHQ